MKLFILTAVIAVVASIPISDEKNWPWQVGKVYRFDANTLTWVKFEDGISNGNAFKAQFIISVKESGHLIAKLENPVYAPLKGLISDDWEIPSGLEYQPIEKLDEIFEILVDGGRILSIILPPTFPAAHENILKALISAIQLDLSEHGLVKGYPNSFDDTTFQGLFKKVETDVTGECETLFSISPLSAEWRRELPAFASEENPIEVIKSKNYGSCERRAEYEFGVPEGAVWKGLAKDNEKQFIKHTSEARIVASKQGAIYKSEVVSSVFVNPLIYGKQKAEVNSYVKLYLKSVEQDNTSWETLKDFRSVDSLLFTDKSLGLYTDGDEKNVAIAQQLLQDITPLLQEPNSLPKGDFLQKFNLLVYILTSLNSTQLSYLSDSIDVARTSENNAKKNMWIIYRDAVALTGTTQAFEEIKSWVSSKKIEGEEAAEVITSFGSSVQYPSEDLLKEFFVFATSPKIVDLKYVNNSALLATTKLFRLSKEDEYVVKTVIPYFSEELKQAIEKNDTNKAQVYVISLGNLGHPAILKVFAPYLEGKVTVTKYLRIQMVTSLKILANLRNEYVRAVLYSILKNTAEPYEVRVAAVLNIFLAFPTSEMMQVIAHIATTDPSTQVRAVIAHSITFAAALKDPRFAELANTAKSVLSSVAEENYGFRYSANSIKDGFTANDEFSFLRELSYIGSENNYFPKYHRAALRFKGTGFTEENELTLSVSDVQDLINYFVEKVSEPVEVEHNFKFSVKELINKLNIKRASRQPLEGALFVDNLNQQKLFTFNENDLFEFITSIAKSVEQIINGVEVSYTKIIYSKKVSIMFPLSSGMAFAYEYSEPLIYKAQVQTAVKLDNSGVLKSGSLENKIDFIYSRNLDGSVGFIDTLGDSFVASGVINKLQFYVPIKINTEFKSGDVQIKFEPLYPNKDINVIHLSVWPYNGILKQGSINYDVEYITGSHKTVATDIKFESYQLQGYSYSADYKNPENLFDDDLLTNIGNILYQKDIALTEFNFNFLGKETETKSVAFTLFFDKLFNQKNAGEFGPAFLTKHVEAQSVARREEMVKQVSSGIESAEVQIIDFSVAFDGPKKSDYAFTTALAYSVINRRFQAAFFYRGIGQYSAVLKLDGQQTKIVPLNFEDALENEINVTYEANIKSKGIDVSLQGYGERTKEYTEKLINDPMAVSCLRDVVEHNLYQADCYKMIIKAHAPDFFKANVTYKEFDPAYQDITGYAYNFLKNKFSLKEKTDLSVTIEEDKLEIEAQAFYYDNYISYNFTSKYGTLNVEEEALGHYPYEAAIYQPITSWERAYNWYAGYQNLPYCAVDFDKVWTFSGRSYEYVLTGSWHVVMLGESKQRELVILARRPGYNQEEVYVSYKTESGKYVELDIKPNDIEVKSNSKKINEGALTIYFDEDEEVPLLEYYTLAEGIQVFSLHDSSLRFIYDKERLVIFANDYRSTTNGLCGQSSSQTRDDYLTPWGLVDLPEYYGASFSLDGEFSDPKTVELKNEAKLKAYQPVTVYTTIPRNNVE